MRLSLSWHHGATAKLRESATAPAGVIYLTASIQSLPRCLPYVLYIGNWQVTVAVVKHLTPIFGSP
jgi:hypothetical protein